MLDQEIKEVSNKKEQINLYKTSTKVYASFLIALSGFILYLDKIFTYLGVHIENLHGWTHQENFVWSICQTISPLLIILGLYFRAYVISLLVPVTCYSLQFYVIFDSNMTVDKPITWVYVLVTSVSFLVLMFFLKYVFNKTAKIRSFKMSIMKQIIEADDEILK